MNLPRSTYYHKPKNESGDDPHLINRIEAITQLRHLEGGKSYPTN